MKFSKISKRLAACSLAGVMMVSMLGMTAFAEESGYVPNNGATAVHFNKVLNMDEATGANTPAVTFNYTIAAEDGVPATTTRPEIKRGVGSPTIDGATFLVGGPTTVAATVDFSNVRFSAPGIYRYKITETKVEGNDAKDRIYENISYDEVADRYLDVYVENIINKATNEVTGYTITNSVLTERPITPELKDNKLVYGSGEESKSNGYENAYKTWSLTLGKTLDGTMADYSKKFSFTITIKGMQTGSKVTVDGTQFGTAADEDGNIVITKTLGNDEETVITGIPANASYEITENLNDTEGYTPSITAKASATKTNGNKTVKADMDKEDETVHYTNTKNTVTPTGVAMTVAPYILMVAVAGIFAILFLRRRHEEA